MWPQTQPKEFIYYHISQHYFQVGYTTDKLHEAPIVLLLHNFVTAMHCLPVIMDPMIYLFVHKDLRVAVKRFVGQESKFSWEDI